MITYSISDLVVGEQINFKNAIIIAFASVMKVLVSTVLFSGKKRRRKLSVRGCNEVVMFRIYVTSV